MTTLQHRKRVLAFQQEQLVNPSANAWRVVEMLERDERDQSDNPDWTEWTPAYRDYIARKIDAAYRGY